MMITIYYYGHDQSEERPVDEFFRGEHHSLIQWQPVAPMAQMPVGGMPMQGMQVAGGMPMSMYAMAPPGDMVTAAPQLNQVCSRTSARWHGRRCCLRGLTQSVPTCTCTPWPRATVLRAPDVLNLLNPCLAVQGMLRLSS